ncbi:hypothetical protein, partial [Rhizobium brockwellii]|uniref:hypothetical protein n=1 Tax=Rhizobium brockwellii TaxID=3019932 RepID=UPI003F97BBA1
QTLVLAGQRLKRIEHGIAHERARREDCLCSLFGAADPEERLAHQRNAVDPFLPGEPSHRLRRAGTGLKIDLVGHAHLFDLGRDDDL